MGLPGCLLATAVVVAIAVGVGLGTLLGHLTAGPGCPAAPAMPSAPAAPHPGPGAGNRTFLRQVLRRVSAENIRSNLREFAARPHVAGSVRDLELANRVRDQWLSDGLDSAHLVPYTVLLSLPDGGRPNQVSLVDGAGNEVHPTPPPPPPGPDAGDAAALPYNAYAPNGSVTGQLVYANFGTEEDFELLAEMGVNVTAAICLVRSGRIFRGNKVVNAARRGAVGVVLFSDAGAVSPRGAGAQWGTLFADIGDPLTPHWPSIEGAHRVAASDSLLPPIPSQPVGYSEAVRLLGLLDGREAPPGWTVASGLPRRLGPGFKDPALAVRLDIHNELRQVVVHNVIGTLRGSREPDRYVVQGNHRDAWAFGASDPSSGTAQLMETARVFGQLAKQGWRPRRTLVFASWSAEEFGVIGSQEWVEEHVSWLMARAVAYVNTDICVSGPELEVSASPSLQKMVFAAADVVASPTSKGETVLQKWRKSFPNGTPDNEMIFAVGSGTDVAPFAFFAGVPVADVWFRVDQKAAGVDIYPAYHTAADTLELMETRVDPDFSIHRACSQLAVAMLVDLADSVLIPVDPTDLALAMRKALAWLEKSSVRKQIEAEGLSLRYLDYAVGNFSKAASDWSTRLSTANLSDPLMARSLNDQVMLSERCLVLSRGLPRRANSRHVLFSPSRGDSYAGSAFSGLTDLLLELDASADKAATRAELALHITEIEVRISEAASALRPL